MLSVTEADDKPLKYLHMFRAADIVIITKSDLLPHVDFSIDRCLGNMRTVNRSIRSFVLSAITGEGVGAWYDWLKAEGSAAVQASVQPTSAPFRPGRQTYRDRPRFRLIYRSTTH
jgi:hydrogenase nickel incorporation protein HypB